MLIVAEFSIFLKSYHLGDFRSRYYVNIKLRNYVNNKLRNYVNNKCIDKRENPTSALLIAYVVFENVLSIEYIIY
jgi:hypothetical protein